MPKLKYRHSQKHYAKREGCSVRTIRNWQRAGAPLDQPDKLGIWLAARKHRPAGTQEKLDAAAAKERAVAMTDSSDLAVGAVEALRRLEQAEADAFAYLRKAIAIGDPAEIKFAREGWLKTGDSLRRYDLLVEQARRGAGQLIPKPDVERMLSQLAFWLRLIGQRLAAQFSFELKYRSVVSDSAFVQVAVTRLFREQILNSVVASATETNAHTLSLPEWAQRALLSDMPTSPETDLKFKARIKSLEALTAYSTALLISQATGKPMDRTFDDFFSASETTNEKETNESGNNEHEQKTSMPEA